MTNIKRKKIKNSISKRIKKIKFLNDKNYLYMLGLAIFIMLPFFSDMAIYGEDILYHMATILVSEKYLDFSNFVFFPPKVLPLVANGFGYGSGIFYPKLAQNTVMYINHFCKMFGIVDIMSALKLTYFFLFFFSGVFMYNFMKKVFNNKNVSLFSSIMYMTFPYFAVDVFVRGALSESFLFLFIPIVFLGVYYLIERDFKKFYIYFVIGYVGMIHSHLVVSVFFSIILLIFFVVNFKNVFTKDRLIALFKSGIMILMFSFSFIGPLLEHKILGDYTVFRDNMMFTLKGVKDDGRSLYELFIGDKYAIFNYINMILIFIVIVNLNNKVFKGKLNLIFGFLVVYFVSYYLISDFFDMSKLPSILCNIQFPWRLQVIICFFGSVIGGLVIFLFKNDIQKAIVLALSVLLILGYVEHASSFNFKKVFSSDILNYNYFALGWSKEYLPYNTKKNIDYYEKRGGSIIVKKGNADIVGIPDSKYNMKFEVSKVDEAVIELPRLYYLGYTIKLDDGKKVKKINYYENKYGFIEIKIKNLEKGIVYVSYDGTLVNKIGDILRIIAIVISLVYLYRNYFRKKLNSLER